MNPSEIRTTTTTASAAAKDGADDDIMKALDELDPVEPAPPSAQEPSPPAPPAAKKRGRPRKNPGSTKAASSTASTAGGKPKPKRRRRVAAASPTATTSTTTTTDNTGGEASTESSFPRGEEAPTERASGAAVAPASVCVQPDVVQADAPARFDLTSPREVRPAPSAPPASSGGGSGSGTKKRRSKTKAAPRPASQSTPPPASGSTTADVVTSVPPPSATGGEALGEAGVVRMSATVEAMRDTARRDLPPAARERMLVADSTSFLTTDPSRDEERSTLASMATGRGTPLVPPPPPCAETPKKAARAAASTAAKKKKKPASEPVVHRMEDIPPMAEWGGHAPSEAEAEEALALPEVREANKHPGKVKTAGLGVAVPPPGRQGGRLREELDRSALSQHRTSTPTGGTPTAATTTPIWAGRWERDGPAEVVAGLDARRMTGGDGEAVRPLAELRTAFSDHHRLTLADARTSLSRYLGGLVEQKCLEIDAAARLLRAAGAPIGDKKGAGGPRSAGSGVGEGAARGGEGAARGGEGAARGGEGAARGGAKRVRRGGSHNLILDAGEREILEAMCAPAALAPPTPPSGVALLRQSGAGGKKATEATERFADSLFKALPSSGFYRATQMPLDEIEVAVLSGASLRDAMSYFMSFDDSVAAMEAVYESARRMVAVTTNVDMLRQTYSRTKGPSSTAFRGGTPTRLSDTPLPRRKEILDALAHHEAQLDAEWQDTVAKPGGDESEADPRGEHGFGAGGANPKRSGDEGAQNARARELWVQRNAARVLRAVLTGDLKGQRHSIMRTIVAREESLLGLYREPAQRCFLASREQPPGVDAAMHRGEADRDAVSIMRRILALEPDSRERDSGTGEGTNNREAVPLLPDLGTPATKAYCADFLRAPDPQRPLERPCINGEYACQAWILAAHSAWPATGGLNRASHAFVMREFFSPDRWQRIQQEGSLPEERGVCLLCARMTSTYYWVQMRLLDVRGTVGLRDEARNERWRGTLVGQSHCNAIEPESGYTEADILPVCRPTDGPWTGILQPIVAFRANSYVPGVCTAPIDLQKRDPIAPANTNATATATATKLPLGPTVLQAVLGRFGETGSGTGSNRADHLLFGPDLGAAGTSVGRTYLGVPRAMPIAGTDRSLGKLLRRELTDLYSADASCAAWWDPAVHPWVFCAFDKTMTAVWHGRTLLSSATPPSPPSFPPQPPPQLPPSPSSPSSPPTPTPDPHRFRLRYRWLGIVPTQGQVDPRFHLVIPSAEARAVAHRAHFVRLDKHEKCVERQMGFLGAASPLEHETAVLDTLALRVHEATAATAMAARDAETARLQARHARAAGPRGARDRTAALRHEARARRLDRLVLALHLWMDEMLDLAYWMQRAPAVRRARYVDAAPGVRRAATLLLYPHGRRFVSLYDLPDLTPWLPYTNVCIERNYWSPPGGTGGVVSTTTETTTTTHTPRKGDAGVGVGAPPRDGSGPPKMTVVATTTVHASGGGNSASAASGGSGGGGGGGGGGGRGNAPPAAASVTPQGMAALAHMVLSKSTPQPCTVRNLDQIAVRNALEDPPLGLAAMDMVHVMLLGNYEGCRVRPSFAVRARVRAQSLAFRGASSAATAAWIREHYRLIHLAFKEWYAQTAACSPAYEAVVADVQHHTEYAEFGRRAADQVRRMLACHGHPLRDPAMGPDADPIQLPPAKRLDDAAHMAHGMSLRTFGKLRKGSFVETLCDRMRSWLRALCTGKENLAQQYKEELTQMTVFSKIAYSQPAYRQRIVADIATLRNSSSQETPASHAADPQQQQQQQPQQRLDPIEPWALGAPLVTLPAALIESFLKWEGDSALGASPWFADSSFFTAEPYQYLDEDSLRAVDLAAWMCARRTDGRFATAWLRWPLGLSAQAYQRVQTLYMSYECCDVADNSFLVQLRRLLFRQRRRVVPAAEYEARRARRDPSIMYERTETIQTTRASTANAATAPRTVAYRIVEEYGTPQARRDFALVYEYANRVQAYQAWSILPLPRRIAAFQAEAVKRRQSLEPWRRTDADLLGSRHLCACGRWACCVVTPPSRPTTSSVTERRRSAPSPASTGNGTDVAPNHHHHQHHEAPAAYNVVPTRRAPTQGDALDANSSGGGDESRSNINKEGRIHDMVKRRSVLGTGYRGKSGGGAVTKMGAAATGKGSSGAVGRFDDMDLRYAASTARWASTDSEEARQDRAAMPPPSKRRRRGRRNGTPPIKGANGGCGAEAGWRDVVTVTTHNVVIPESAEPVTRDIHPASATHAIGEDFVSCDLGQERRLVSKDSVSSPHCTGRLFRVNLLGRAVRPKGPKAQSNGPWYTLCATCGALTTVDMGRWDHRGPTCGAHGRPHRLPDRLAAYDERIEGSDVSHRARSLLARAYAASDTDGTSDADDDADDDEEMEEEEMEGGWGSEMVLPPSRKLADRLRRDLSALDARAGLPCTDEVPECWSCNSAVDRRQVSAPSHEEARDWGAFGAPHSGGGRSARVVRFHVGTSVATAPIGSAGAALYARSITLSGTHQAAPVRRINIRGAMFGSLGGARGGNLLAAPPAGEHSVPRSNPHLCARGQCPCFADVVHIHQRHQLAIAEATKSDEEASAAAAAVVAMDDETFVAMGRMARRHAPLISSRVLPAELLPVVGEEVTLKVLDDVHAGSKMRLRWIYLCPVHMKDLRVGWITISGRLVQIDHQKRAKGMEDRHIQLQAPEMIRAAAGRAIGAQAIVNHLFSSVPLLSVVLRALRRGSKDRMRQLKRYGGGALQGMRTIPDFSGSRKRRAREGS